MSQLQIGLVSLGALIILAVLVFNWWQERNIRREMFRRFDGPIDDVLMQELRNRQPSEESVEDFHIDPETVLESREETRMVDHSQARDENNPAPEMPVEIKPVERNTTPENDVLANELPLEPMRLNDPEPVEPIAKELPSVIDPQIDEVAIIRPNQPCSGATIRDALQPLPDFGKPVRWFGQDTGGTTYLLTKEHEQIQFTHIVGALQLADRSGAASGGDLRNFHAKVEDLAIRLGGTLEWREHGDPLKYARELDQFCIEVDVMISLQLLAGSSGPFAATKLRGLAEEGGLTLNADGRLRFLSELGESQFELTNLDQSALSPELLRTGMLRGVNLMMDVPRVTTGVEVFNQMVILGHKLETALSARLMDENQRTLGDAEIDKIRQQLKVIYSKMFARGIIPGSPSALRLFS